MQRPAARSRAALGLKFDTRFLTGAFPVAEVKTTALTLGLAALATWAALMLGFPAPFITGPSIVLALVGLLSRLHLDVMAPARHAAFLIIGLTIGSAATPDLIAAARAWPLSMAALVTALAIIMASGTWILVRVYGFTPRNALLGCTPGHLSFVLSLATMGEDQDVVRVSLVQSVRLLMLTLAVPFALKVLGVMPPGIGLPEQAVMVWPQLLVLLALTLLTGGVFLRLGVPAAMLLAGMVFSIVAHAFGWVTGRPPSWMTVLGFMTLGGIIGSRFSGVRLIDLKQAWSAGLLMTVLSFVVAFAAAALVGPSLGIDMITLLIAFAPGGLETMAALAIILDADGTFVAAHHLARMLALPLLVTGFLAFLRQRRG